MRLSADPSSPHPDFTSKRVKAWPRVAMGVTALACAALLVNFYVIAYRPGFGLTKLIVFGANYEDHALPRLRTTKHYVEADPGGRFGYDGQFYAQLALDPALRKPELGAALDAPGYRARRIGLPAVAWALGLGKARWVLQGYAVANAGFWLVLLGVSLRLLWPWTGRKALCLAGILVGTGTVASISRCLTDLPATSLVFASLALPALAGAPALAWAILTRETSLLALPATLEFRGPLRLGVLGRNAWRVVVAVVPCGLWFFYVKSRFPETSGVGVKDFSPPLQELTLRAWKAAHELNPAPTRWREWRDLLFVDFPFHELVVPIGLLVQGSYLAIRPQPHSGIWRVGALYGLLGACLGPSVWEDPTAAARALLPLTVAFYLHLAVERRAALFWPFFSLATLPTLHAIHVLWLGE